MEIFDTIYKPDTLNIFTDASMYPSEYKGYTVGCAGVELATSASRTDISTELYRGVYIPNYIITLDTTNNNSELIAIRQGISFAIANKDRFREINLFSDSLISVNSLNSWIDNWFYKSMKNRVNGEQILMTSSGTPVANQDILKSIIAGIYYNNLKINIYHLRGHQSNRIRQAKNDFIKNNRIKSKVYDSFIEEIITVNDIVDKRSRDIMNTFINTGYAPFIINNSYNPGIVYDISRINFKHYKELIGKGRPV